MTESEEPVTVEKRLDKIGEDLSAVRVLYEHHDTQIQRIAEVQLAHGDMLEQHGKTLEEHGKLLHTINGKLEPLRDLHDFVRRLADDHERRIAALEGPASNTSPATP